MEKAKMPLFHAFQCDKCGHKHPEWLLVGPPSLGDGDTFVCDKSWLKVPEGWYVLDSRYPETVAIYCPSCRDKLHPEKIVEAREARRVAERRKLERTQEKERAKRLNELAKPTGPPLTEDVPPAERPPL